MLFHKLGLDLVPKGVSIIGVSEIENRGVLEDLVKQPAIANRTYEIVRYDSPDRRGVDVDYCTIHVILL